MDFDPEMFSVLVRDIDAAARALPVPTYEVPPASKATQRFSLALSRAHQAVSSRSQALSRRLDELIDAAQAFSSSAHTLEQGMGQTWGGQLS